MGKKTPKKGTGISIDPMIMNIGQDRAAALALSFSQYVEGLIRKDNMRLALNREITATNNHLMNLHELRKSIDDSRDELEAPIVRRST